MISPISGTLPADWRERAELRRIDIFVGSSGSLIPQEAIVLNSVELTEQVCDSKFHLGGVIASRLCFTLNSDLITFGDDSLEVREHIVLDDESEYDIPLGRYQIDRTDSVITQTGAYFEGRYVAYDSLVSMLDKEITKSDADEWALTANKTLSNLLSFAAGKTGLALRAEDFSSVTASANNTATPNYQDGAAVGYLLDKAVELKATYRDLLSCIGALLCGAFTTYRAETLQPYLKLVLLAPGTPTASLSPYDRISSQIDTQPGRAMIAEITFGDLSAENPLSYPTNSKLSLSVGDNLLLPLPEEYNAPEIQGPAIVDMLAAVNCRVGNWTGYKSVPQKLGDPLVLTNADITYFGDPTIEAGDCITVTVEGGQSIDLIVMEHICRFRQPSVIRSYGDASSVIYTSAYSPSYGETKRPTAYDAATAKQIAKLTEGVSNAETAIDDLSDDLTADEALISDLSDRVDAVEEKLEKPVSYSLSERLIGNWVDNSELYEKSFEVDGLGGSDVFSVSVAHNIDRLKEIVESRGQLISGGVSSPLTDYSTDSSDIVIRKDSTDRSSDKAYITLRYLKNKFPDWFPTSAIYDPDRAWFSSHNYTYYAIIAVYRWNTTPMLIKYSDRNDRSVTITANASNQIISSGFGGAVDTTNNDSTLQLAGVYDGYWGKNSGYWYGNSTVTGCPKAFLYETNFTNLTLVGIPKE